MPKVNRGVNFLKGDHEIYAPQYPAADHCTAATAKGKFCDDPVPADCPISVCTHHLHEAWAYAQAVMDRAADHHYREVRDFIPRLNNQALVERVRRARSVVYYALSGGYIKIGTTMHLDKRMRELGANLIAVEPGTYDLEADRHRQFHALLATGKEYFFPGHELIRHIAALQERYAS